jgi:hypothetical protein
MPTSVVRVVVELPSDDLAAGGVVLAAALSLFDRDAEIVVHLSGGTEPTEQHAVSLSQLCHALVPSGARMADIVLLSSDEALATEHLLHVEAGLGDLPDARAVILLSALADLTAQADAASQPTSSGHAVREAVRQRIRQRDDSRAHDQLPIIVAVAQVQSTWGALDAICQNLLHSDSVRLEVVALGSQAELRNQDVWHLLRSRGYEPKDLAWFENQMHDPQSAIELVLFDNPYDLLRPDVLRSTALAARGVRTALVPYGNNVGAGDHIIAMQYDTALHRLAWRVFARSEVQREMYERYCGVGSQHVRVLGLPKLDRVLEPAVDVERNPVRQHAGGRPIVLWNPHFSVGENGWSTLDRYLSPMIEYFGAHSDAVLLVRPHFRLTHDAGVVGGPLARMMDHLAQAVAANENIVLDVEPDYLQSFQAATALVSDLSSLITEFLPTGKPLLYLHRTDGPGVNEDAEYVFALDVATSWPTARRFLDDVRAGVDRRADVRRLVVQRHFTLLDGRSARRIGHELLSSLQQELGLASPVERSIETVEPT